MQTRQDKRPSARDLVRQNLRLGRIADPPPKKAHLVEGEGVRLAVLAAQPQAEAIGQALRRAHWRRPQAAEHPDLQWKGASPLAAPLMLTLLDNDETSISTSTPGEVAL